MRLEGADALCTPVQCPTEPEIEAILRRMDDAVSSTLEKETVKDLITGKK
jgi:hypothetical protein